MLGALIIDDRMKPVWKLTAANAETKSSDIKAENLAALRALFPELVTERPDGVAVNLDVLKQLVGDQTVTDAEEQYGLNCHGKRRACPSYRPLSKRQLHFPSQLSTAQSRAIIHNQAHPGGR